MSEITDDKLQIDERFVINDLETLKVLADPLRLRIIEAIGDKPHTVKQVAKMLGLPPNKLYYHVNLLEEHGLIRVVDTRIVSGIIEKIYLIRAHTYSPAKGLLSPSDLDEQGDNSVSLLLDSIFEDARAKVVASMRAGLIDISDKDTDPDEATPSLSKVGTMRFMLTDDQAAAFAKNLADLVSEYQGLDTENTENHAADIKPYRLVLCYFPQVEMEDAGDDDTPDTD